MDITIQAIQIVCFCCEARRGDGSVSSGDT